MIADLRYFAADALLRLNRTAEAGICSSKSSSQRHFSARTRAASPPSTDRTGLADEAAALSADTKSNHVVIWYISSLIG